MTHHHSELRQDLVSGDWIVIAPKRAHKPEQFFSSKKRVKAPIKGCPFEHPDPKLHGAPLLSYSEGDDVAVQIVRNRFPAFQHIHNGTCALHLMRGPYGVMEGVGHHDLVITRDHHTNFAHLSPARADLVFRAFQERYHMLAEDPCSAYVSIFHNWGSKAGASIYHPHFQIIALPIVPPDVEHSLEGSSRYFQRNRSCVHCAMLTWEHQEKRRIIFENDEAIVFAPFVSREPFELRVFPKTHSSYFEDATPRVRAAVAEALQHALRAIETNLRDPDYNFFIHTSPIQHKSSYHHYHWHIEIQPKISVSAGFELGTGIEITVVDPDEAATILKK